MSARRGPGEGHIKRIALKSGKVAWRGWLTIGYRANGTPIRRSCQRRTRDEVREGLIRLRAKYRVDLDHDAEMTMRFSALSEKWIAHHIATKRPKTRTIETYRWAIGRAERQLGDPLVARTSPTDLQNALNTLASELGPKSMNLVRIVLDGCFRLAVLLKVRPDNPAADLEIPRPIEGEAAPRLTLDAEAVTRYLWALRHERLGLAVALTYGTAMRPSEVSALLWSGVDLKAGTVAVHAAHNVSRATGKIVLERPKSKNGRRVLDLSAALVNWFYQHHAHQGLERMAMGERWTAPDEGLVFVRATDGGPVSGSQIYDVARRVAEQLGLGKIGPRVLRRSMLSTLAAAGVDKKVRAAIGGHTSEVTEQHYREVDPREMSAAMGHIADILAPLAGETGPDEPGL